jgi:hypothetical protein
MPLDRPLGREWRREIMRMRLVPIAVALAVGGSMVAGSASATTPADTRVTIKTQNGDFWGAVFTSRPLKCARNRKVVLYKQLGADQNPSVDDKVASDTASLSGGAYKWNTGTTGLRHGKFYARVAKTTYCKADTSETVNASG